VVTSYRIGKRFNKIIIKSPDIDNVTRATPMYTAHTIIKT